MSDSFDPASCTVHVCAPGAAPLRLDSAPSRLPEDNLSVLWVDVPFEAAPEDVLEMLVPLAPDLCLGDVQDLLDRDELAKTHDHAAGFRNASFVGFDVRGPGRTGGGAGEGVGDLVVQMVETLVGQRLVVSCWQRSRLFHGAENAWDDAPVLRSAVMADVVRTWRAQECETSADLASALVQALLFRSRFSVAELEHSLQRWELAYHAAPVDMETESLKLLLAMVNEMRRRLSAFENARLVLVADEHRFRNGVSLTLERRVDELVAAGLKRCGILLEGIRASMELVSMDKVARQAELAKDRADRDAVFQGRLEKVTALLLVPTLIAGIFGANTALPGGGTWMGFETMVVLMLVTSLAVYVFLVYRRASEPQRE